jgi:hypothetical protein
MRPRITFANVASALALFIALGGTALATHPGGQNTIFYRRHHQRRGKGRRHRPGGGRYR